MVPAQVIATSTAPWQGRFRPANGAVIAGADGAIGPQVLPTARLVVMMHHDPATGCLLEILLSIFGGAAIRLATPGAWVAAISFGIVTVVLGVIEARNHL